MKPDDGTPRFFPCSACGARIGKNCRSDSGEVKYFHRMRRQENRLYRWAIIHKNEAQIKSSLEWRNRK